MERSCKPCLTKAITSLRRDSGWMNSGCSSIKCQQLLGVFGKAEIEIFLDHGFRGAAAIGARIAGLRVVHVGVVEDAVLAGVVAFINLAAVAAAAEQVLDDVGMAVAGGALEAVDVQAQDLPLLPELFGDGVGILLRTFFPAPRRRVQR